MTRASAVAAAWLVAIAGAAAWLVAIAGAAALIVAASMASSLTAANRGFALIFNGLALAIAIDASVGATLLLKRLRNVVGAVLVLAAILMAVTFPAFVSGAVLATADGALHAGDATVWLRDARFPR